MAVSDDLINFDLIETHKENIQALPGGRSARQLVSVLSPMPSGRAVSSPSLDETKTFNEAMRQEYELELQTIADADDPLDVYDRYVKWTLSAYPSAQATPQSKLLPLLERATKAFSSSSHYKNDPRYLKFWLHYIRFFSDSPRETFAFLARHSIGDGLGLFYEEFAAWLEGAGRWGQAQEVYKVGLEREARPTERLMRKYAQFQHRFEARPRDGDEPSSPALPTVRPVLAAKVDPYSSTPRSDDAQATRPTGATNGLSTSRSGKPKMAIFSDVTNSAPPPVTSADTRGWDSIGSIQERKKENSIEARPWAGETLQSATRVGTTTKMNIFKDQTSRANESSLKQMPHTEVAVSNSRTGKVERVFVNLEAVYPYGDDPGQEFCFEELRAKNRGWTAREWRKEPKSPLRPTSGNVQRSPPQLALQKSCPGVERLVKEVDQKLGLKDILRDSPAHIKQQNQTQETKMSKTKKIKVREIKQTVQTIKTNLESPTGPKLRRKISAEPTMTFHSRAATDEIYNMFNQSHGSDPDPHNSKNDVESDDEDDDYSTAGESTGTGRISGATSEFEGDDTVASVGTTGGENTRTGSQPDSVSPWSEFTASKHLPKSRSSRLKGTSTEDVTETFSSSQNQTQSGPVSGFDTQAIAAIAGQQITEFNTQVIAAMAGDFGDEEEEELETSVSPIHPEDVEIRNKPKFVPIPPEDYEPTPVRPFRDPSQMAQNRLPFMTPIVEKTESSLAPSTIFDEKEQLHSKTPSRSFNALDNAGDNSPSKVEVGKLFLSSPVRASSSPNKRKFGTGASDEDVLTSSPQKLKSILAGYSLSSPREKVREAGSDPRLDFATLSNPSNGSIANGTTKNAPPKGPIILDLQCNPVDQIVRRQILTSIYPPLSSYKGFHDKSSVDYGRYPQMQRFAQKSASSKNKSSPRKTQSEKTITQAVQPILDFQGTSKVYVVRKELGKGAFAPVYLVESHDRETNEDEEVSTGSRSNKSTRRFLEAVKTETPPSAWEFHILRLLRYRLGHMSRTMQSVILAHECHLFRDECYLVLEYHSQGTLLDLVNGVRDENRRAGKSLDAGLDEGLAMFLGVELLRTMVACHGVGIIHGDLKADNCLVRFDATMDEKSGDLVQSYQRDGSFGWSSKGLTLIDFGRGVDFRAFKPEVQFIADWPSSPQDCAEIREARPWTWQIDYFGAAGVIHSLLFGKYIETVPATAGGGLGQRKEWKLKEGIKRYWQGEIWTNVFGLLLNPTMAGAGEAMPCLRNLKRVIESMESFLEEEGEKRGLRHSIKRAEVLVNGRRK